MRHIRRFTTCATGGKAVCAWKAQAGELIRKYTAEELLEVQVPGSGGTEATSASTTEAVAVAV